MPQEECEFCHSYFTLLNVNSCTTITLFPKMAHLNSHVLLFVLFVFVISFIIHKIRIFLVFREADQLSEDAKTSTGEEKAQTSGMFCLVYLVR